MVEPERAAKGFCFHTIRQGHRLHPTAMLHLRMRHRFLVRIDLAAWHAFGTENVEPLSGGFLGELLLNDLGQLVLVLGPQGRRLKLRSVEQIHAINDPADICIELVVAGSHGEITIRRLESLVGRVARMAGAHAGCACAGAEELTRL